MANKDILDEALDRFKIGEDAEAEIRTEAAKDQKFLYVSDWDPQVVKNRQGFGQNRPCLSFPKLLKHLKKITNEVRLNNPAPRILPEDDKADKDTADKINGLVKQILKNANSDTVFSSAFENSVESSFGYFRVITKFENDESFNQIIDLDYIDNPFSVYFDPASKCIDGSDAEWGFITDDIPKEEFKREYPNATVTSLSSSSVGDNQNSWIGEDTVRVAEYYRMVKKKDKLIEAVDGKTGEEILGLESELRKEFGTRFDGLIITRERETVRKAWKWYKITANDVLDSKDLPGVWFPLIPVYGRRKNIENKKRLYSLIRFAKDAQRMYNYWRSSEAEQLSAVQKTPFIGAKGQFNNDPGWKDANTEPKNYLEYDPVSIGGQLAPPPQKVPAPEPPIGYIAAAQSSNQDIKEIMGVDEGLTNETTGTNSASTQANVLSGKAISLLNQNGEISTYDFIDNLNKSVRHCYRVIVDLIPEIYDTERVERMLGDDNEEEVVVFNGGRNEDGKIYDLSTGKYDVDIDVGPDFATKRQQSADSMMEFIGRVPIAGEVTGDLVAKAQDWKDSDKFADRIKRQIATINPNILEDDEVDENQLQIQLTQAQSELQSTTQQLDQALELIQTKQIDQQMSAAKDQAATEREIIKSQTALEKQRIDTEGEIKEETIQAQSSIIQTLISSQEELKGQVKVLFERVSDRASQTPPSGELPGDLGA